VKAVLYTSVGGLIILDTNMPLTFRENSIPVLIFFFISGPNYQQNLSNNWKE